MLKRDNLNSNSSNRNSKSNGGLLCVRVSLILFNLITLLAGIGTLGIGVWLFVESHNTTGPSDGSELLADILQQDNIPNHGEFKGFSILLMSLGTLVGFVSFIGCFGACIKSRCLLLSYLTSVVLILSLQLLVAVFVVVYRQPVSNSIRGELINNLRHSQNPNSQTGSAWDMVHQKFQCCGVESYEDWYGIDAWPNEEIVPDSCCLEYSPNVTTGCGRKKRPSFWHKQGCLSQIQMWILQQLHILASAVITLIFLQLYGIIASTLLFYHTKTPKPKSPKAFKSYPYERARM